MTPQAVPRPPAAPPPAAPPPVAPPRVRRAAAALGAAAVALGRLVLPVACAGCDADDVPVCPTCTALLGGPRRCEQDAGRLDRLDGRPVLPVWTLGVYTGPMRGLVVAWKDRGRADVTATFTRAAARGARELAPALAAGLDGVGQRPAAPGGRHGPGEPGGSGPEPLLVVPAPSTAAARRRRGEDPVGALARAVAHGCREGSLPAVARPVLVRTGRGRDQVGLGSRARARNLSGHIRVRRSAARDLPGRAVLLVDDVLTTGATLAACELALAGVGAVVVGALTLSATPSPGDPSGAVVPAPWQV